MAEQLCRHLAHDGHEVTVVTQMPHRTSGRAHSFSRRSFFEKEIGNGYKVIRCATWLIGKKRRARDRALENMTFGLSTIWQILRLSKPDLVILETWPLMAVSLGILAARMRRTPVVNYVQDVYPEAAAGVGILERDGIGVRVLRRWDRILCLASAKVIAISDEMKTLLDRTRRLPDDRTIAINNWIDSNSFPTFSHETNFRKELGIPANQFIAMFGGTLGLVSGAEVLIEVADRLKRREDIHIVCIGEGVLKPRLLESAARKGLKNIRFLPYQASDRVPEVQGSANALILTVQEGYGNASVPSKLISYLAAGRPVICSSSAESTVARVIERAGAGVVVPGNDAASLARSIETMAADPALARTLGINARRHFEEHFTFDRAYSKFTEVIASIGPGSKHTRTNSSFNGLLLRR